MGTAEDLPREVWRLLRETRGFVDPEVKRELAERAFMLAQRAQIIELAARSPRPERHDVVDGDAPAAQIADPGLPYRLNAAADVLKMAEADRGVPQVLPPIPSACTEGCDARRAV